MTRLLHAAGLLVLLALGVSANSVLAWAVLAMPMTLIVVLALTGGSRSTTPTALTGNGRGPFDALAMEPSVVEPSFDSPISVVARKRPAPVGRGRR